MLQKKSFSLHIPAFILALTFGLLYVYLATPHRRVVIRQPTLENAGKIVYEDEHQNCFVLDAKAVACDSSTTSAASHNILSSIVGDIK